jgi:hypothetical protein
VQTNADSGPGSLRAAITAAANGDTIVFDHRLDGQTIALSSGELAIGKDLTIVGPSADRLAVSGSMASRVFDIASGVSLVLARLMVADGLSDQGGGIQNAGTLTLQDVVLSGNEALGDSVTSGVGGGLFNEPGAALTATRCTFTGNQVVGGQGIGFGGGIYNLGVATVTGSAFTGNLAVGGQAGYGAGGAINDQNNATLTVSSSTFTDNQAVVGLSALPAAAGGAIDNEVGSALTVSGSTFARNSASATATDPTLAPKEFAAGGAILTFQGTLRLANCAFTGNQVTSSGYATGGALENQVCQASVTGCAFADNETQGVTGGGASGGALENYDGTMTLTDCTLVGNEARGGDWADGVKTGRFAEGGAILNDYGSTTTLIGCTVLSNLARGGDHGNNSGAPAPDSAFAGIAQGGAIFNYANVTLTIRDSTFMANEAVGGASAVGPGPQANGGAIVCDTNATLDVSGTVFTGNLVVGGAGAAGAPGGPGQRRRADQPVRLKRHPERLLAHGQPGARRPRRHRG